MVSFVYAQEQGTSKATELMSFVPLILVVAVFYFFLVRPQQRKEQQRRKMVDSLARGDRVVTSGGLIGVVYRAPGDTEVVLELREGVQVSVLKTSVVDILAKVASEKPGKEVPEKKNKATPSSDGKAGKSTKKQKI